MNYEPSTTKMVDQKNLIMQNEPNFQKTKMNITSVKTKYYESKRPCKHRENEPNTNPIYAKQSQIKANFIAKIPFSGRCGNLIRKLPGLFRSADNSPYWPYFAGFTAKL